MLDQNRQTMDTLKAEEILTSISSAFFIQNDINHCAYIHSVLYFDPIR
jgi:hypothetical protein